MALKLKLNESGNAVLKDGSPVYINEENGAETVFDANLAFNTQHTLREENKSWRQKYQATEEKLKAFGDLDPEEVKANMDAAQRLKEVDLVKKGEMEKLNEEFAAIAEKKQEELKNNYEKQINQVVAEKERLENLYNKTVIGNHFLNSAFIKEKIAVPADMIQAAFGNRFKVDGEKVIALSEDGSPMLSEKNLTKQADFEEALELMVKRYPYKDAILKATQSPGGGMNKGGRGSVNDARLKDPKVSAEEKLTIIRKQKASGS
jgi:hypothetical protein